MQRAEREGLEGSVVQGNKKRLLALSTDVGME